MTTKKSKIKIRKQFVYEPQTDESEQPYGVSRTVPDMSLSLREILNKHTKGMPLPAIAHTGVFSHDELPDIKSMDLTEIAELQAELTEIIQEAQQKIHASKKAIEKKQYEEEIERRIQERKEYEQRQQDIQPSI